MFDYIWSGVGIDSFATVPYGWIYGVAVILRPDMTRAVLRNQLAIGMGHNSYGEPAWPNDLLYIFPIVILGTLVNLLCLAYRCRRTSTTICNTFGDSARVVLVPDISNITSDV